MKNYTIKQDLTDRERYKLTILVMLRAKTIRKMIRITLLPAIIISTLLGVTSGFSSHSNPVASIFLPLIFPLIIILIFTLGPLISIKLKKVDSPTYKFDDWGMTIINKTNTISYPWHDISTYSELSSVFLITIGSNDLNTHIIPKKEFKDIIEIREFIDILNLQRLKRK